MGVYFSLEMSVLLIHEVECEVTALKIRKYVTKPFKKTKNKKHFSTAGSRAAFFNKLMGNPFY